MNIGEYIDAVIRLARERGITITEADAESTLDQALDALAKLVTTDGRGSLFQRRFQVVFTSGVGALSAIVMSGGASLASVNLGHILTDTITNVQHSDGTTVTTFHHIPGNSQYDYDRTKEFGFYDPYIVRDNTIQAKKADQSSLADGTLTFSASAVPTLTGVPVELEADLVVQGVLLAKSTPAEQTANG